MNFSKIFTKIKKEISNTFFSRELKNIFIGGTILRLVLMPFFAHQDILSTYKRAYLSAFEGKDPFTYSQPLSHFIEAVNLKLFSFLNPAQNYEPWSLSSLENSYINLNLFIFKLPYIIFDFIVLYFLHKLVKNTKNAKLALAFYYLNPILIFAVYIFGRYETIPLAFVIAGLFLLKKGKNNWASLIFGITFLTRFSFFMILPAWILTVGKTWKEKLQMTLITIIPYALVTIYQLLKFERPIESSSIQSSSHTQYLFDFNIKVHNGMEIYPFFFFFFLVMFLAFSKWLEVKYDWNNTVLYITLSFYTYFGTAFFHPQYLAWIVPTTAILIANSKKITEILLAFIGIIVAYPLYMLFWEKGIFMEVFTPLHHSFWNINLAEYIDKNIASSQKLYNIGKSLMSIVFILLSVLFYRKNVR